MADPGDFAHHIPSIPADAPVANPEPKRGPNGEPDWEWMKERSGKSIMGDAPPRKPTRSIRLL
jgi:hypothetical protein